MTNTAEKKIVIIGGGPGGYMAAIKAAQKGARVTLVEADRVGGTCVNKGCIPTKALIQAAAHLHNLERAAGYGISTGEVRIDFKKMMKKKDRSVATLVRGIQGLLQQNQVELIKGSGRLISPREVEIDDGGKKTTRPADCIILAMGSENISPPIPGVDSEGVVTSTEALVIDDIPGHLLIVGGGYIGLEFASIYSKLGSRVTLIEKAPRIIPLEERETALLLSAMLEESGIGIFPETQATAIDLQDDGRLQVRFGSERIQDQAFDKVLVAVGRAPRLDQSVFGEVAVERSPRGIVVDSQMRTSIPGIYAIGDVVGNYLLAHVAYAEAETAVDNIFGEATRIDYERVPRCTYTIPEFASVGMTESQAKLVFPDLETGRFQFQFNGKALISDEQQGLVKIISEPQFGEILGVHIVGAHATELIAEAAALMTAEATVDELIATIHSHPTLSEAIQEAALDTTGCAAHKPRNVS